MTTNATQAQNATVSYSGQPDAAKGLSELGTSWIWELLIPVLASLGLAIGRAGRAWGIDASLARRRSASPWW